jgi:hypothetical protein
VNRAAGAPSTTSWSKLSVRRAAQHDRDECRRDQLQPPLAGHDALRAALLGPDLRIHLDQGLRVGPADREVADGGLAVDRALQQHHHDHLVEQDQRPTPAEGVQVAATGHLLTGRQREPGAAQALCPVAALPAMALLRRRRGNAIAATTSRIGVANPQPNPEWRLEVLEQRNP